jgi:hypothetical protein
VLDQVTGRQNRIAFCGQAHRPVEIAGVDARQAVGIFHITEIFVGRQDQGNLPALGRLPGHGLLVEHLVTANQPEDERLRRSRIGIRQEQRQRQGQTSQLQEQPVLVQITRRQPSASPSVS